MGFLLRAARVALLLSAALPSVARAQAVRGVVLDQTGLPLPGATIEVMDGTTVTATVTTGPDGSFAIAPTAHGALITVKLEGFETTTVPRSEASRVVLPIARTSETTEVVAPTLAAESPVAPLLGNSLTATDIVRLPSSRLHARESLPLLPSVVRGADGLLRLGGARPSESPLLLDGFDLTDPATGLSSINLPFEAVRGVEVLRDPAAVTYGDLLGGLVQLQSKPGGDNTEFGVQGFIPRPRFTNPGFGRIEGIFPRVYFGGSSLGGRVRYFTAAEYDFERIPVPDVTRGSGPNIVEKSSTVFARVDIQATDRSQWIVEGLVFPSATDSLGLSVRREEPAAPDISATDAFAGITNRFVVNSATMFTVRVGVLSHQARQEPHGSGLSVLSPAGWKRNWFATLNRRAIRYGVTATWQHVMAGKLGAHDVTLTGSISARRLHGTVTETPVVVEDDSGRVVRSVDFDGPSRFSSNDHPQAIALRDVWSPGDRLQIDAGVRLDRNVAHGGSVPSARSGMRFAFDEAGVTVLKASVGRFVGTVPLAVQAFSGFPTRTERLFDETGEVTTNMFRSAVGPLRLPRALAVTAQIERQLLPGLDTQFGFTSRRSTALATLDVPRNGGTLVVGSLGGSEYREAQISIRRVWDKQQQLFVSYVHSSSRGELNDFGALFQRLDVPLLQPQGLARLVTDAPDRVVAWGTFNLPARVVVSPVIEWHSGFPYSLVDDRYLNVGAPNSETFPAFMALDLVVYKTFTYRGRAADFGIQLFNATDHFNPRDVNPVMGASNAGLFTNSVGPILRGFMMIKW